MGAVSYGSNFLRAPKQAVLEINQGSSSSKEAARGHALPERCLRRFISRAEDALASPAIF